MHPVPRSTETKPLFLNVTLQLQQYDYETQYLWCCFRKWSRRTEHPCNGEKSNNYMYSHHGVFIIVREEKLKSFRNEKMDMKENSKNNNEKANKNPSQINKIYVKNTN
eukprot:PhF_6_TR41276/c0_g1_i4/m.62415